MGRRKIDKNLHLTCEKGKLKKRRRNESTERESDYKWRGEGNGRSLLSEKEWKANLRKLTGSQDPVIQRNVSVGGTLQEIKSRSRTRQNKRDRQILAEDFTPLEKGGRAGGYTALR